MASYAYTFTSGDTVTPTKLNNARTVSDIVNADIKSDAAIAGSKLADGAITNAKVDAAAAIAGTKITPNFGSQNIVTTGTSAVNNISFINGAAATFRIVQLQTSQVSRWNIGATDAAESGSNAGSNLFIDRFADNGDFLERCFNINRSTGNVSIGNQSPQGRLHIESGSDTTLVITDTNTSTFSLGAGNASALGTDSSEGFVFKTGVTTGSLFSTGTERMRIKATGQVRFQPLSSDPAGGESGDVYYNSSTNKLRVYNGTSWVDLH
jgi:hypothetical protein